MRGIYALVFVMAVVLCGPMAEAQRAGEPAVGVAKPVNLCYEQKTKQCCDVANATLTKECSLDGYDWVCSSEPITNEQVRVTARAAEGYRLSHTTGQESKCEYKEPACGDSVGECHINNNVTEKTCEEKVVAGAECSSGFQPVDPLVSGSANHCG